MCGCFCCIPAGNLDTWERLQVAVPCQQHAAYTAGARRARAQPACASRARLRLARSGAAALPAQLGARQGSLGEGRRARVRGGREPWMRACSLEHRTPSPAAPDAGPRSAECRPAARGGRSPLCPGTVSPAAAPVALWSRCGGLRRRTRSARPWPLTRPDCCAADASDCFARGSGGRPCESRGGDAGKALDGAASEGAADPCLWQAHRPPCGPVIDQEPRCEAAGAVSHGRGATGAVGIWN